MFVYSLFTYHVGIAYSLNIYHPHRQGRYDLINNIFSPSTAKLFNWNFHPLEVVPR